MNIFLIFKFSPQSSNCFKLIKFHLILSNRVLTERQHVFSAMWDPHAHTFKKNYQVPNVLLKEKNQE
jgi:hypothetical protein